MPDVVWVYVQRITFVILAYFEMDTTNIGYTYLNIHLSLELTLSS